MGRSFWALGLALAACSSGYTLENPDAGASSGGSTSSSSGGAPEDAGPGGPGSTPGHIACGTEVCDLTTQACCVNSGSDEHCQDKGKACAGIAVCDEAADCPSGKICCGSASFDSSNTDCEAKCDGINQSQPCRTDTECGSRKCIQQSCFGISAWLCGLNSFCQKL